MSTADTRPPVFGVHHTAYRCRDAEETRAFYEDKLGFPMTLALEIEEEPSTGNPLKYLHVFFDIGSHKADEPNYIAFFELPDTPADESTFAQKWGFDLHLAMRVDGHEDLAAWKPGGVEDPIAGPEYPGQRPDRPRHLQFDLFQRSERLCAGVRRRERAGARRAGPGSLRGAGQSGAVERLEGGAVGPPGPISPACPPPVSLSSQSWGRYPAAVPRPRPALRSGWSRRCARRR